MAKRLPSIPSTEFAAFLRIVRRLRRDCPWDRKQTHRSLRDGMIEETYEVIESLDDGDTAALRHELGDLLLHIALQATIAEERGEFTLREVLASIAAKLVRRHPHVFGTARVRGAEHVKQNWARLKMKEGRTSILEGVPRGMPALQRALRVQERAAGVGFDWKARDDVWAKVREELEEFRETLAGATARRREAEFGDLLFALVNYARFTGVNPEHALRRTVDTFTARFRHIEREIARRGREISDATLEEMDALWNEAKKRPSRRRHRSIRG